LTGIKRGDIINLNSRRMKFVRFGQIANGAGLSKHGRGVTQLQNIKKPIPKIYEEDLRV